MVTSTNALGCSARSSWKKGRFVPEKVRKKSALIIQNLHETGPAGARTTLGGAACASAALGCRSGRLVGVGLAGLAGGCGVSLAGLAGGCGVGCSGCNAGAAFAGAFGGPSASGLRTRTSSHALPVVHVAPSGLTSSGATETTLPTCQLLPRSRHSTRSLSLKRCTGGCGVGLAGLAGGCGLGSEAAAFSVVAPSRSMTKGVIPNKFPMLSRAESMSCESGPSAFRRSWSKHVSSSPEPRSPNSTTYAPFAASYVVTWASRFSPWP
jgi:hypothetical protein